MATLRIMPQPIFLLILNALYKGFQMRYHLFQKFFGKMVKIKETSFLSTRGIILMFGNCRRIYMGRKCKILLILLYNCKREIQTYSYSGKRFLLTNFFEFSCTLDYQKSSNSTDFIILTPRSIVGASEKAYFSFRKS